MRTISVRTGFHLVIQCRCRIVAALSNIAILRLPLGWTRQEQVITFTRRPSLPRTQSRATILELSDRRLTALMIHMSVLYKHFDILYYNYCALDKINITRRAAIVLNLECNLRESAPFIFKSPCSQNWRSVQIRFRGSVSGGRIARAH